MSIRMRTVWVHLVLVDDREILGSLMIPGVGFALTISHQRLHSQRRFR